MEEKIFEEIKKLYEKKKANKKLYSQSSELVKGRKNFQKKFNIEILKTKEDKELLRFLFLNAGDKNSIGYEMEYGLGGKKKYYFYGTFNQMQAPAMLRKDGKWSYQDPKTQNNVEITEEKALNIAYNVKNNLIEISEIIENIKNNKIPYNALSEKFEKILKNVELKQSYMFFRKYIFNLYPDLLSSFINNDSEKNKTVQKAKALFKIQPKDYKKALILEEKLYNNFKKISIDDIFHVIIEYIDKGDDDMPKPETQPLNQILYGPPGTGKTYNTIIKAVEIIEGKKYTDENNNLKQSIKYEDLQERFNKYKNEGRIEFITFHQSYSYEEFIEGIKPNIDWEDNKANDNLQFIGQKGIFRKICHNASEFTFDKAYEKLKKYLENNKVTLSQENSETKIVIENAKEEKSDSIKITPQTDQKTANYITKAELKHPEKMDNRKGYANAILKFMKDKNFMNNFVLIIDEINRGNISKIFGELITLIEDDKRETLPVTLPYSREPFTVPKNLYIIGTMNTADKSLALLDVALRRRFEFVPMYPKYEIDGTIIYYSDFLNELNKQILIKKKSADYLIGHSYFMSKNGEPDLKNILNKKVIPLLMEYFNGKTEDVKTILETAGKERYKIEFIDDKYHTYKESDTLKYYYLEVKNAKAKSSKDNVSENEPKE